ncbi:MAG: hypothetical protein R3Y59_09005 [bacterium]
MKVYYYPNVLRLKSSPANPFSNNFITALAKEGVVVTNKQDSNSVNSLSDMIRHHSNTDIYILNWIENIAHLRFGTIQSVIFILFFFIQLIRNKKFVWVFHNITPHDEDIWVSKLIKSILLKRCSLFITLSKEGYNILSQKTQKKIIFINHPINQDLLSLEAVNQDSNYDILIWGTVSKYKGIIEFLDYLHDNGFENRYKILIIGKCTDKEYEYRLLSLCNEAIEYRNCAVAFCELKGLIASSKIVLFPYIGGSISSSGALIDTITFNGRSVGPSKGAFIDLSKEGVCLTYDKYDDIIEILSKDVYIQQCNIDSFLQNNSWSAFVKTVISAFGRLR